jgi:hypothetical protein
MAARECDVSHSLLAILQKNMKTNLMLLASREALVLLLLFAGAVLIAVNYTNRATTKYEQGECQRWQQQAIDYAQAGFYLTDWQIEQCEAVGYPVKVAPVVPRKDFN